MAEGFPDLSEAYQTILIAKPSSNVYSICRITSSSSTVGSKRLLLKKGMQINCPCCIAGIGVSFMDSYEST
jgi:hypothetical protein